MIHYALRCAAAGHGFDSWFADAAAFDRMAAARLLECPVCGDSGISKALMAPAVSRAAGVKGRPEAPSEASSPAPAAAGPMATSGPMPALLVAQLQRLRAEIERQCDYVGPDFAEEARRIHHGESAPRGIYGEATDTEAAELHEEGIAVGRVPWVPRAE